MSLTVVIPTHNRVALLGGAIRSVLASPLIRSPQDVIVVDDQSDDQTPAVARELGVRYLRVAAGGPSGSRNAGLALSDTPFVSFLDDDDEWLPGNMRQQFEALERNPQAAFAFGRVQRTTFDLQPFGAPIPATALPSGNILSFVEYYALQVGSILFRRSTLVAVGGFDESLRFNEDSDLLVRLASGYPAIGIDVVGSLFRQRPPNARDAALRWPTHRARNAAIQKWRRCGIQIPLRARLRSELNYRGMTSYSFCEDAATVLASGEMRAAALALVRGLWISPLHALVGHRRFWTVLPSLSRALVRH